MYYLFIIKENYFKDNSKYLYQILYKLKNMNEDDFNYGVNVYNSICKTFDVAAIKTYLKHKTKLKYKDNKFYIDKNSYVQIRKSCCVINNDTYLRELLSIFYIYNKNIFVCNFNKSIYFWIK